MDSTPSFKHFSDGQLAAEIARLVFQERSASADVIACLEEFDRRRLYLALGFTSIYAYCRERLHLTDGAAYRRIETARAVRRHPVLLAMLRDGRLSLATVCLLGNKLTPANAELLLLQATHKSKREVEALLACANPMPPVPSIVRKLPAPSRAALPQSPVGVPALALGVAAGRSAPAPPSRRPIVAPLSEAHYKLQVTISGQSHDRLRRIQDLMRHAVPSGDPAAIVERALALLEDDLLKKKAGAVSRPRQRSVTPPSKGRHVPNSVKRQVWARDRGQCAFTAGDGRRCGERGSLEYHHVDPYAHGGQATPVNIELRCRAHNGFEWERHVQETCGAVTGQ